MNDDQDEDRSTADPEEREQREETTVEDAKESTEDDSGDQPAERPTRRSPSSSGSSRARSSSASSSSRPAPRKESTSRASTQRGSSGQESAGRGSSRDSSSTSKLSAVQAVLKAKEQFEILTDRAPESVIGVGWEEDHWTIRLEVVESRRIPDTSDLLAEYVVELDAGGEVRAYTRHDRYVRGRPSE